jgi:hypothetical protein
MTHITRCICESGAEEVYGEAVMRHPALASGLPVLMKCPPGIHLVA